MKKTTQRPSHLIAQQQRAQIESPPTPYRVTIFRRTIARGWEKFYAPPNVNCSALPKKECIEIRALKLRISLKKVKCMVQRGDSLLVTIEQSGGDSSVLVMMKFVHYGECASFCDDIIKLNQNNGWKRGEKDSSSPRTSTVQNNHQNQQQQQVTSTNRSEDTLSYIVRLLHDRSFNEFVDDIEGLLRSSPDCAGILAALGEKRPFSPSRDLAPMTDAAGGGVE